jgi:hypothetical protein
MDYESYCTNTRQVEIMRLHYLGESAYKIGKMLGMAQQNVHRSIAAVKRRMSAGQPALHVGQVPDGYKVRGTSQLIDYRENPEGQTIMSWVKTDVDKQRQAEIMAEAVTAMCGEIPRLPAIKSPKMANKNLLNLYVITDFHFGMLAWHEETRGDDWDTKIAEETLVKWFEAAIALSPDAETGVFCNLGDFLHFDSLDAITPTGHNLLDSDTRFAKVVRVVISTVRRVVDMLLHKHKRVHLLMAEGNHDLASSVWLREMFAAMYEREKRITIDRSPDPYYCIEHGLTSLFFHHGHKKKMSEVDSVFAAKFRDVFGRTKYSYAHMGHYHHTRENESNLMTVTQHRTLAAADAYASRGGHISGREASVITYHKDYGYAGQITITPEMIR